MAGRPASTIFDGVNLVRVYCKFHAGLFVVSRIRPSNSPARRRNHPTPPFGPRPSGFGFPAARRAVPPSLNSQPSTLNFLGLHPSSPVRLAPRQDLAALDPLPPSPRQGGYQRAGPTLCGSRKGSSLDHQFELAGESACERAGLLSDDNRVASSRYFWASP